MKKIIIILLLILSFDLVCCAKKEEPENKDKEQYVEEPEFIGIDNVVLSFDSETCNLSVSNHANSELISKESVNDTIIYKIKIVPLEGYGFLVDKLIFNWTPKDGESAKIDSKNIEKDQIIVIFSKNAETNKTDSIITDVSYKFVSEEKLLESQNKNIGLSVDEEIIENKKESIETTKYQVLITPKEGYSFSSDITLNWEKIDTEKCNLTYKSISDNKIILIFEKSVYKLYEIKISLDTTNYVVTGDSSYYSAEIEKPLDYIRIITKVTININISDELVFIVNEKEIAKDKYTIELIEDKYVLTYKIDDPNWTPYY